MHETIYIAPTDKLPVVVKTIGDTRYYVEGRFVPAAKETAVDMTRKLVLAAKKTPGGDTPSGVDPCPKEG